MTDKDLEGQMLKTLDKLDRQRDRMSDTPKRHEISELIVKIRQLVQTPHSRILTCPVGILLCTSLNFSGLGFPLERPTGESSSRWTVWTLLEEFAARLGLWQTTPLCSEGIGEFGFPTLLTAPLCTLIVSSMPYITM